MNDRYIAPYNVISRAGAGVVGGIAGGLLLGLGLWALGDLDETAKLVGAHTLAAAWVVHVVLCAVAGACYGVLFGRVVAGTVPAIGVGIVYGTALWVVIRLVAIPIATAGRFFAIDGEMVSLAAFAIFGVVLGLIYGETGPKRNWRRYRRQQMDVVYAMPRASRRRRRRRDDDED